VAAIRFGTRTEKRVPGGDFFTAGLLLVLLTQVLTVSFTLVFS
jgi:hypothetical protein